MDELPVEDSEFWEANYKSVMAALKAYRKLSMVSLKGKYDFLEVNIKIRFLWVLDTSILRVFFVNF